MPESASQNQQARNPGTVQKRIANSVGRTEGPTDERTNGQTDGQTDRRTDGQKDGQANIQAGTFVIYKKEPKTIPSQSASE